MGRAAGIGVCALALLTDVACGPSAAFETAGGSSSSAGAGTDAGTEAGTETGPGGEVGGEDGGEGEGSGGSGGVEDECLAAPGVAGEWSVVDVPAVESLSAVYPRGSADVWVVGDGGRILHFDGNGWEIVPSPAAGYLSDVWIPSAEAGWIVGEDRMLRYDGSVWTADPDPLLEDFGILSAVWGPSARDVWVGGGAGPNRRYLARYGGGTWTTVLDDVGTQITEFHGIEDRAWAVAHLGQLLRYDGEWNEVEPPEGETITSVWMASDTEAWFAALRGEVHRFQDGQWQTYYPGDAETYYYATWGFGSDDLWIAGYEGVAARWNGEAFSPVLLPTGASIFALRGLCPDDVWAVGDEGTVLHFGPA